MGLPLIICMLTWLGSLANGNRQNIVDVTKFGARGDGETDDSQAFLKAWEQACRADGSHTLQIPRGGTFKLKSIKFQGPCKSNRINFHLEGTLVAPGPSEWLGHKNSWIVFKRVDGLTFHGTGKLYGNGNLWWPTVKRGDDSHRPTALAFQTCKNLTVKGYSSVNSPRNHITLTSCKEATISNVSLNAPGDSPNTDGIDIIGSSGITIQHSLIATGDDCVAINSGVNGVKISDVKCGPGHGISVGSLGRNGSMETAENILVYNCTFTKTTNGARIKTFPGGSGYARRIRFERIKLIDTKNPIIIDQNYGKCDDNCPSGKNAVKVSDVKFIGFEGTAEPKWAIQLNCSHHKPCDDIVLQRVNIQSSVDDKEVTSYCKNSKVTTRDVSPSLSCSN